MNDFFRGLSEKSPPLFEQLVKQGYMSADEVFCTVDGWYASSRSLADIMREAGITMFYNDFGQARDCDKFYDDWYLYAVSTEQDWVYSLFKMREQESDAKNGGFADGDIPGATVSFVSFEIDRLLACLKESSIENLQTLNRAVDRTAAARGQHHHEALKSYFVRPQAQGAYLIAELYTRKIAAFAQDGCIPVPEKYAQICVNAVRRPADKKARLVRFIEENNAAAGTIVCDHAYIRIADAENLTVYEKYAILATHTANTSFNSFATEVRFHALFLTQLAKIPIPGMGRSPYDSAIRADMSIGDSELRGPAPYYDPESKLMREQRRYHGMY